jgi:hypothetical protein
MISKLLAAIPWKSGYPTDDSFSLHNVCSAGLLEVNYCAILDGILPAGTKFGGIENSVR